MSKERIEIEMNYPPTANVDVWSSDEPGWKEAIVAERITTETLSGSHKVKWRVKLKGDGYYLQEKWVHGTNEIRLRNTIANDSLMRNFWHTKRLFLL